MTGKRKQRPASHERPSAPRERRPARGKRRTADPRRAVGARGETLACEHLERRGFEIVSRNFRTRRGEIDVVAFDGCVLAFVEVKTLRLVRASDPAASTPAIGPLDGLRFSQRHRIRGLANAWLAASPPTGASELRFDAIGVTIDRSGALLALEHLEGAW